MIIKINDNYDFTDDIFMAIFNQELKDYTDNFGWSYNPEVRELNLNIPDGIDTNFLTKYSEVENF